MNILKVINEHKSVTLCCPRHFIRTVLPLRFKSGQTMTVETTTGNCRYCEQEEREKYRPLEMFIALRSPQFSHVKRTSLGVVCYHKSINGPVEVARMHCDKYRVLWGKMLLHGQTSSGYNPRSPSETRSARK